MDRRSLAGPALFTVNLLYGINYAVAKGLMPAVIAPSGFVLLRVIGATLLFFLAWLFTRERIAWSDLPRLCLCAVFGVALNQLMFFHGLMRTSPLHASLIMVATPILVLVISAMLLGERVTRVKLAGILLGACGAVGLVLFRASGANAAASMLGDLFILINASSYGVYLVLVKPLMQRYSAVTVMLWSFAIGLLLVLPFGFGELSAVPWSALTASELGAMAFVVVMVTFVAYLLNTWAMRFVQPSVVGTYIYLQPAFAVLFGWFFRHYGQAWLTHPADPVGAFGPLQWA
ncbi:MAG TPA: DMT family transporter, partial [Flavobacteriales bacterium]|nr:DMT family transporter [Flavobacteriales bacterium]